MSILLVVMFATACLSAVVLCAKHHTTLDSVKPKSKQSLRRTGKEHPTSPRLVPSEKTFEAKPFKTDKISFGNTGQSVIPDPKSCEDAGAGATA